MTRAIVSILFLVACRAAPAKAPGVPGDPTAAPAISDEIPASTSVMRPATPTDCGPLEMSAPPSAECAPKLLADKPDGPLLRVWESPCPIYGLRNDGAVEHARHEDHYTLVGEPPHSVAASRLQIGSTVAGPTTFEALVRKDGTRLFASDRYARCETLPLPMVQGGLAGTTDGRVFYWAKEGGYLAHDTVGAQLVERTRDATWRIAPPLRPDVHVETWEQNGRVVFGYRSTTANEIGYYDVATLQLRPIRRAAQLSNLQLVPGAASGEPPTALYTDERRVVVDLPDVSQGYRRLERSLLHKQCPDGGPPDPKRRPTGTFEHQGNPILLRTNGAALWLAYTDVRGRCTYHYEQFHAAAPRSRDDVDLIALRRPPPPPRWRVEMIPERASLVLVPIERGRFGDAKRVGLPARHYHYSGPWQFHPSATPARIRLAIGSTLIDLDPNKLGDTPALATPWPTEATNRSPAKAIVIATPPPANAPPFPALRTAAAVGALVMTAGPERTVDAPKAPNTVPGSCLVRSRTASDPKLVDRQLVLRCEQSVAIAMAAGSGRVAFTQFSQTKLGPMVEIDATDDVHLVPQPVRAHDQIFRFANGRFVFSDRAPAGAPPIPSDWRVVEYDDAGVLASSYNRGNELMRGTIDRSSGQPGWSWKAAFAGGRTPPTGMLFWPVFLRHGRGDPTIVFSNDPRVAGDVTVRTPDGQYVALPTWGKGSPSDYRVHDIASVAIPGERLPIVAAKIDDAIVVGVPDGKGAYTSRAIVGYAMFPELATVPPGATTKPVSGPRGPRCSESLAVRDREEVYSPQLFAWGKTVGLAYLSTRVHEQLRFTIVAPACGWVVDTRTTATELAIARLDATGATEVLRVPVEYRGGTGAHGSNLLIDKQGAVLHTIATSYGTTTYTRIALP